MDGQLPTASRSTVVHRRKIRDSCNECSGQKIRCGKQRPACTRCVNKKLQCNYAYSQRTGRRSSSSSASAIVKRDASSVPVLPAIADDPASTVDLDVLLGALSPSRPTSPKQAHETQHPNDISMDLDPSLFDDPTPQDLSCDFLMSPSAESLTVSQDSLSLANAFNSNTVTDLNDQAFYGDSNQSWLDFSLPTPASSYDTVKTVSTHPLFDQEQLTSFKRGVQRVHTQSHDCMALALRVTNDLSVMREPCAVATSDPMAGIESSKTELRDVDSVLFVNRDAARSIKKILGCTCASDTNVALACYLATSKIIDWYDAAIRAMGSTLEDTDSSKSSIRSNNDSQGAMAEQIIARPIFMGKYCLDREAQRVVGAQVVLGELREHVQPLLTQLPRYQISGHDTADDATGVKTPTGLQTCALREQLRTVIHNARALNRSR
ncbi:hypothetical protein ACN47E_006489 [Coniothyrium glycines]